eukprot:474137-Rhodomonas_salina.1
MVEPAAGTEKLRNTSTIMMPIMRVLVRGRCRQGGNIACYQRRRAVKCRSDGVDHAHDLEESD